AISAQVAVVPLGRLMAVALPERAFFRGRRWEFTLNPGPFNVKEHVLITIFANAGAGSVFAINLVTAVRVFYGKPISFFVSLLVVLTSQVLGFGWAGIFRRYLVEPVAMWWPSNLVQVSLFRALHEKERRRKGGTTRTQFFMVAFACSFAYYIFPGYLFEMLTSISWICWIFPTSVVAQQLGSGLHGLGIGAIGLDWSSISSYLGSPLASPLFATANIAAGFFIYIYVVTPITYWFKASLSFQMVSLRRLLWPWFCLPDRNDCPCSPFPWKLSKSAFQDRKMDVHTKLMRRYRQVPEWWFICILVAGAAIAVFTSPGLNIITEYDIMGFLYPGRPVANMCFKVYGHVAPRQALAFLQDFKLGHYMKIPPRTMFMAQVVGTLISAFVYLGTARWMMDTIPNICNTELLPAGSPWTCPYDHLFYDASVIWGLISPRRIFGDLGTYSAVNWFFLGGAIAPLLVWLAHKAFPGQKLRIFFFVYK
ncbi:hypothetical protein CFC21_003889, partial [Triticum aestivum]